MLKNVCLLATGHPVTKTYIQALVDAGFVPNRIVYVNIDKTPQKSTWQQVKNLVKKVIKPAPPQPKNTQAIESEMRWNQSVAAHKPIIQTALKAAGLCTIDVDEETTSLLKRLRLPFQTIRVPSINDEQLAQYLINEVPEPYVIFCGGGILRKNMFATGKRFIHIHPGVVPDVKGADCLLWSSLVRGKIGMSVFFMNEGIDTGDIILTKEYAIPPVFSSTSKIYIDLIPQQLIGYLDPAYRAAALVESFKRNEDPEQWQTQKQEPQEGAYYHFMHPLLAQRAIKDFFVS